MRRKVLTLILCALLTVCVLPTYTASASSYDVKTREYFSAADFAAPIPQNEWWKPIQIPEKNLNIAEVQADINNIYDEPMSLSVYTLVPVGTYYITAYCSCSKCCWPSTNMTASGTTCHYEDNPREPTTCAIDRKLHSFGDTFYLKSEGRMYVAEDTGSAVKGKHIDLYFPDHSYVQSYGSHYETVYTVKTVSLGDTVAIDFNKFNNFDISYRFNHYRKSNSEVIKNFCPMKYTQNIELLTIGE